MTSAPRARDGRCQAQARSRGRPCQAPIAVGALCWRHCAATLQPAWTLTLARGELRIWPGKGDRPERRRLRVCSGFAAYELIRRGVITRAVYLPGKSGMSRLFRRLERAGVVLSLEGSGELVRVVRFSVPG